MQLIFQNKHIFIITTIIIILLFWPIRKFNILFKYIFLIAIHKFLLCNQQQIRKKHTCDLFPENMDKTTLSKNETQLDRFSSTNFHDNYKSLEPFSSLLIYIYFYIQILKIFFSTTPLTNRFKNITSSTLLYNNIISITNQCD